MKKIGTEIQRIARVEEGLCTRSYDKRNFTVRKWNRTGRAGELTFLVFACYPIEIYHYPESAIPATVASTGEEN